jgi:hypothetical protein
MGKPQDLTPGLRDARIALNERILGETSEPDSVALPSLLFNFREVCFAIFQCVHDHSLVVPV